MTLLDFRFSYTSLCSKKGHPHQVTYLHGITHVTSLMATTTGNDILGSFSDNFDAV